MTLSQSQGLGHLHHFTHSLCILSQAELYILLLFFFLIKSLD